MRLLYATKPFYVTFVIYFVIHLFDRGCSKDAKQQKMKHQQRKGVQYGTTCPCNVIAMSL